MGWEVVVVTPQSYTSPKEIESFNNAQPFRIISLEHLPSAPMKAIYRYRVISGLIKKLRPQIILASGDREVLLSAVLAKRFELPWIAVEHGRIPPSWERPLKRWCFGQATAVVCVSRYTSERLLKLGVRPRRMQVILNGAELRGRHVASDSSPDDLREEFGPKGSRILLTVGSVTERKGQDVVISALPSIISRVRNTHYLIAGLPTRQHEFEGLAVKLGVSSHVHFLGQVDDDVLMRLYSCCDLFVMTSRHTIDEFEGFGIAVVEAALFSKPAIVSAQSGLVEAILDGVTGFGVPENDEVETARKITLLLEDEELLQRMGKAAFEHARTEQTWGRRVREYDALLREVVQQGCAMSQAQSAAEKPETA
ncbi:MAG: glycosyltransferase family 4 protein [Acidobacteriota bacterium]|nr:glycosyltransferase family 4 protein [Acidobacteriota bacterium]